MRQVFVDTAYWIAMLNRKDQGHQSALSATEDLKKSGFHKLVTTQPVLTEVLSVFSEQGEFWKLQATEEVEKIMSDSNVIVIPQTNELFRRGLDFWKKRPDKGFSHVDCMSMVIMKERGVDEVLTSDTHFEQEGFVILMK